MRLTSRLLLAVALLAGAGGLAEGQPSGGAPAGAEAAPVETGAMVPGPVVSSIGIEFDGVRNVSTENIRAHLLLRVGEPFTEALADQSIRSLYESGNFEFISLRREPGPADQLDLVFVVTPKYRISAIRFEGNESFRSKRLLQETELEVNQALDRVRINRAAVSIFEYYQKKGFANARVTSREVRDEATGAGEVIFTIDEGVRYKIDEVTFVGNSSFSEGALRKVMKTKSYIFLWSWLTGRGRLIENTLEDDLEKLRQFYRDRGFLDVVIDPSLVRVVYPSERKVAIEITVSEGQQYRIASVAITGHTLFNDDAVYGQITLRPGDIFSPPAIEAATTALKDFYGRFGYLDTLVRVEREPNLAAGTIGVTLRIREGDRFDVEALNIQGNVKTRSEVIVRELALAPGDVFDLVRMKVSESRLKNTGFFETVNLSPESSTVPGRRNLRVNVTEGRTGNLSFGAGFSSLESIVAFAEFQQTNFDIFGFRNGFQGAGQKLRVRASIGVESNSFIISFEEPWVFQRRIAFGFELFRQRSEFISSAYNELRMGFEVYLRKRLFELVDGRLSYRLELVEIDDVSPFAAEEIQQEEGSRLVSKVGFLLSRDTRNAFTWTTQGNRVTANFEVAGVGGDTYYFNQEYRVTQHFLLFDDPFDQSIRLHARTGTIYDYTGGRVPFFDRYFLGGPYTLRGFGFREVGPRDSANIDPTGGGTMAMAQFEYTIRFVDPLGLALFYDIGFVNREAFDWSPVDYNDNWGFGLRVDLMGAPLNLDFGFPITSTNFNDDGMQFNFSFGTAF